MSDADLSGDDPNEPLGDRLVRIAYSLRDALLAHPHAAIIAMSRSLRTPAQLRPVEKMLEILLGAGLTANEALSAVNIIGQYTFGTTMAYANHLTDSEFHHDQAGEEAFHALPADEFPNILRALDEAEIGQSGWNVDFDAGVHALVKGLVLDRAKQ